MSWEVPAATKSKDVKFDIGRTWLQIWARNLGHRIFSSSEVNGEEVPRLQGKLFGRLKARAEANRIKFCRGLKSGSGN